MYVMCSCLVCVLIVLVVTFMVSVIVCYFVVGLGVIRLRDVFFFQAEDGIRDLVRSRGLGDVYKRQPLLVADPVMRTFVPVLKFLKRP